jgi:hypothetical protein
VQIKQKKSDKAAASKQAAIDKAYNKIKMNLICSLLHKVLKEIS